MRRLKKDEHHDDDVYFNVPEDFKHIWIKHFKALILQFYYIKKKEINTYFYNSWHTANAFCIYLKFKEKHYKKPVCKIEMRLIFSR